MAVVKRREACQWLMTILAGIVTAPALVSSMREPAGFNSRRYFAAWLGLVQSEHSTGGKEKLGE
jgi:transposase